MSARFVWAARAVGLLMILCISNRAPAAEKQAAPASEATKPAVPAKPKLKRPEWFESLKKKYTQQLDKLHAQVEEAQAKVDQLTRQQVDVSAEYVDKLMAVVEKKPNDETALNALLELVNQQLDFLSEEQSRKVFSWLAKHHASHVRMLEVCQICADLESDETIETLLTAVVEKNKHSIVKAWALFAQGTTQYYIAEESNEAAQFAAAEKIFEKVVSLIPEDQSEGTPRDAAEKYLFELKHLAIGKAAPNFEIADLDGKRQKLHDQLGKIVVLDFWATWCGYCVQMIPHERKLMQKYADQPVQLISISGDDDTESVREFLVENPMPWTHWWNGPSGGVVEDWNIQGFPTIFVLDAKGIIRYRNVRDAELEKAIDTLLQEMKKGA